MPKEIHTTALVSPGAELEEDVFIGPYCIVGDGVVIRRGTRLNSHVVVEGDTVIGEDCAIYPFTSIGLPPQDMKYKGEKTGVRIGNRTTLRENITIHRGSVGGDGLTEIGEGCFLMAYVHIAHDCKVGNSVIMANSATLAGHVQVEDHAVIGGVVVVHQNTRIGAYAMVGGFSGIGQDIPPYTMASGSRARLYGLNSIGLKRHGFTDETINTLKKAYKILFREKRTLRDALRKIKADLPETAETEHLLNFIDKNKRGICR
ncbi:MAG: acyl-ACP--UDP-N-acetylglucosamine O-acyltransferase [Thermodesulfovibrionales bacterium]|jgi:UDP-N-acetylglucosamine acyltransferase